MQIRYDVFPRILKALPYFLLLAFRNAVEKPNAIESRSLVCILFVPLWELLDSSLCFLSVYDDTFLQKGSFPSCARYSVGPFNSEQAAVLWATSGLPLFL